MADGRRSLRGTDANEQKLAVAYTYVYNHE